MQIIRRLPNNNPPKMKENFNYVLGFFCTLCNDLQLISPASIFYIISPYFKATLGGGAKGRPPAQNFLKFMQFFFENLAKSYAAPSPPHPGGSASPTGNIGSTLDLSTTTTSLETRNCLNESCILTVRYLIHFRVPL